MKLKIKIEAIEQGEEVFTLELDTATKATKLTGNMYPADIKFLKEFSDLIAKYKDRYTKDAYPVKKHD